MTEIDLAFLWHMHQPYYPDPLSGVYPMPWVRLHGIKGYYDMPSLLREFPEIKYTINLTPSLIYQLKEYLDKGVRDKYFLLSAKRASDLTQVEKVFLLKNFFLCRKETMIQPNLGYLRLLNKRGTRPGIDMEKASKEFSDQEFLDLQCWFNLAWFGFSALKEYPELNELKRKARNFSEDDKMYLLKLQMEILSKLIPLYQDLWNQGKLEISTTPFYHPILPLLIDTEIAREALPGVNLPPRFSWPEDARGQLKTGLDFMEQVFSRKPIGLWPSENAVSDDALKIIAETGLQWTNTCEQLLKKTKKGRARPDLVYHPYQFQESELKIVFRDQELSDLISFNYSQLEPEVSVTDFTRRLDGIRMQVEKLGKNRAFVLVALDGENPWESFPQSGYRFLSLLFQELSRKPEVHLTTVSEALKNYYPEKLEHLSPGTWIKGDFDIWIGAMEENKAWDYLGRVRKDAEQMFKTADPDAKRIAQSELFAAEGSDWFWWYGDDFYSDLDTEYDEIFRTHLRNVYLALGKIPPLFLEEPVKFDHPVRLTCQPVGFISPIIDGRESSFYEWQEAGCFDVLKVSGIRSTEDPIFSKIHFGFDLNHLYLRLDPHQPVNNNEDFFIEIHFEKPHPRRISFPYHLEKNPTQSFMLAQPGEWEEIALEKNSIRKDKIFELAVAFSELGFAPGDEIQFQVYVLLAGNVIATYPRDGLISLKVPDKDFESRMWTI